MHQMPYIPYKNNSNGIKNIMGTPKQNVRLLGRTNENYKLLGNANTPSK